MNNNHSQRPAHGPPAPTHPPSLGGHDGPPGQNVFPQVPPIAPSYQDSYLVAPGYMVGTPMYPSGMINYNHPQVEQSQWAQAYARGTDRRYFQQNPSQTTPMAPMHDGYFGPPPVSSKLLADALQGTPKRAHMSHAQEVHAPSSKQTGNPRRRALTACDACRVKKVKCDNTRPKCGSCVKNNIADCHYRTNDFLREYGHLDTASESIMMKLDEISRDLKDLKGSERPPAAKPVGPAIWDMSVTSLFQWRFLQQVSGFSADDMAKKTAQLNRQLLQPQLQPIGTHWAHISSPLFHHDIEQFLAVNVTSIYNSFFRHCHNKIPILDIQQILGMFEMFILVRRADPEMTFPKMLDDFDEVANWDKTKVSPPPNPAEPANPTSMLPPARIYRESLEKIGAKDLHWRQASYQRLCQSTPYFLVVAALGLFSTELQLNNVPAYSNSLAERDSLASSCVGTDAKRADSLPASRMKLARLIVEYAHYISILYPATVPEHSVSKILYHLLAGQFELLSMRPLDAYKDVVKACHQMIYYLEERKYVATEEYTQERTNLLFWGCLKLENELRAELSPAVPSSGIIDVPPPIAFPLVPRSEFSPDDSDNDVPGELRALTHSYVDRQSWYFFLTEIAFRKVDDLMYQDFFLQQQAQNYFWDTHEFSSHYVWHNIVKYLNHYNGIINSLNPRVREFVLLEVNTQQIYENIKERTTKAGFAKPALSLPELDEFFMDDDMVIKMQSESIVFIKTRITASKILLFRPLVYLVLEDKIGPTELFEAILAVFQASVARQTEDQPEDPISNPSTTSSDWEDVQLNYQNLMLAPNVYQKLYPDEDFSLLIEYDDSEKNDPLRFRLTNMEDARAKLLRTFVQHLISIPKLNMPKLLSHRHPGSWYMLRTTVIGNIYMYCLYKKISTIAAESGSNPTLKQLFSQYDLNSPEEVTAMLDNVVLRHLVASNLEHTCSVLAYWKEECPDCEIYIEVINRLLQHL